jgi:hypothetical protein
MIPLLKCPSSTQTGREELHTNYQMELGSMLSDEEEDENDDEKIFKSITQPWVVDHTVD